MPLPGVSAALAELCQGRPRHCHGTAGTVLTLPHVRLSPRLLLAGDPCRHGDTEESRGVARTQLPAAPSSARSLPLLRACAGGSWCRLGITAQPEPGHLARAGQGWWTRDLLSGDTGKLLTQLPDKSLQGYHKGDLDARIQFPAA